MTVAPPGRRSQRWALGLTAAAQFVLQLDLAIVNVALPALRRDLGFSAVGLQWVVTGYALTFGAFLLPAGRLGDRIGHRRMLLAGLAVFGAASLAGGLSPAPAVLVGARLLQGTGAALVAPAALALLVRAHPEPRERARAMGVFQGAVAAGALAGILAGGAITQYAGWRWVLLVNPPLIVILLALVVHRIPPEPGHDGVRLDAAGGLIVVAAAGSLILGVGGAGLGTGGRWWLIVAAAALIALLVVVERRSPDPLLPGPLLGGRRSVMLGATLAVGAALAGYVYFVSLYMQRILGASPGETGLALAPATLMVMITSMQVSHRLPQRLGAAARLVLALGLICAGQLWLSRIPDGGGYLGHVLGPILVTSAGIGLALPAASLAVTQGAAPHRRGIAGALFAAGQQLGSAVGLAALAVAAAARTAATGATADGYRLAFLLIAAVAAAAAVVVAASARRR